MGQVNCGAIPMAAEVQSDMATPALAEYGSDYLKREFLMPSLTGEVVSCLGVSEPHAGSDVAAIRTYARKHNDDLIITGSKICKARGRHIEKLGMHCSDTAEIFFDNVRVPMRNIIGDEGRGFFYQMSQFQHERLVAVAVLLEPLSKIIDTTMEYARERQIFGQPELNNQIVSYQLAEMRVELESVRSLLYRAVLEKLSGEDVTILASMAKFKAARIARSITDSCLQASLNGHIVSRFYRDLRLFSIAGGCDEVMLSIISRHFESKN
uniref:Acyl-CoA dehydrogenase/oxidase C-terminal domain-containing protein n=2 Tax=Acrobeloides nanus TaxID=290746 RepID=A0A914CAA9_9BILA